MIYIMHTNSCVYLLTIIRRDFSVSILIRIFFYMILSFHLFLAESDLPCSAGFSLVVGSRDFSSLQCAGFSLWWLLLLQSTGSRHVGFSS